MTINENENQKNEKIPTGSDLFGKKTKEKIVE